jgi:hypothetical protein
VNGHAIHALFPHGRHDGVWALLNFQ